jgi:hypothetical protein
VWITASYWNPGSSDEITEKTPSGVHWTISPWVSPVKLFVPVMTVEPETIWKAAVTINSVFGNCAISSLPLSVNVPG